MNMAKKKWYHNGTSWVSESIVPRGLPTWVIVVHSVIRAFGYGIYDRFTTGHWVEQIIQIDRIGRKSVKFSLWGKR